MAEYVIKRDGSKQVFDRDRITTAVYKAMLSMKHGSMEAAEKITDVVVSEIEATSKKQVSIEEIQDKVEQALMKTTVDGENYSDVARAYILYRERRKTIREEKLRMGVQDDLKLSLNSVKVLESRYLLKDQNGKVIETPSQMMYRVARAIALIEGIYEYRLKGSGDVRRKNGHSLTQGEINMLKRAFTFLKEEGTVDGDFEDLKDFIGAESKSVKEYTEKFESMMRELKFMPNSPTLMNAGTSIGQLSACFVLPVEDSIESIFNALKDTAIIHKSGGGTGFSFSRLRQREDLVGSTSGVASGPLSFMTIFDTTTDVIKQGGKRRGANMGILRYDHPDIMDFILSKDSDNTKLKNFNISVALDAEFFAKLDADDYVELKNPRDGKVVRKIRATSIWESILNQAWKTGDPGLIFVDKMNEKNTVAHLGQIEATNPCVTGDTLLYTSEGLRTARDLYEEGNPVHVATDARFSVGMKPASNVILTGVKPVVSLKTADGFQVRLTADHRVYSDKRGWVEAGKLKPGEKIRVFHGEGGFGQNGSLEEGRVLGWLAASGHINNGPWNNLHDSPIYGNERPPANNFSGYVSTGGHYLPGVAPERLKDLAMEVGLEQKILQLPEAVFFGKMEMQKGFLQAIFEAGGSVSKGPSSKSIIRLKLDSEDMLRKIQLLLLNFGIYSRISRNRRNGNVYKGSVYLELAITEENILRFQEKVGFLSIQKAEKLTAMVNRLEFSPGKEQWVARVESIDEDGEEEVFDLIEPITHSFVGNGIVLHNCGEQPLLPHESCNLGSINLAKFVTDQKIDFKSLEETIRLSTRFLDDVIDANNFPIDEIRKVTRTTRKIGLGYMGFADMLAELGISYQSREALETAEKVMKFLNDISHDESSRLAKERGNFPGWHGSSWERQGLMMRNSTTTTIAPTGTISIIADCSSSIEPFYALAFVRHVLDGQELLEVNRELEKELKKRSLYSDDIVRKIAEKGNLKELDLPNDLKKIFITAHEIEPQWHVMMQATFQRFCDSGVSKTINLPQDASVKDIEEAYRMAWDLNCKGITVYRDKSKGVQVLTTGNGSSGKTEEPKETVLKLVLNTGSDKMVKLDSTFDPACPDGKCAL